MSDKSICSSKGTTPSVGVYSKSMEPILAGPFMGHMFLVVVDSYTKWLDVFQMQNIMSRNTFERLRSCFATHDQPDCNVRVTFIGISQWNTAYIRRTLPFVSKWLSGESGSILQGRNKTHAVCPLPGVLDAMAYKLSVNITLNHKSFTYWNVAS